MSLSLNNKEVSVLIVSICAQYGITKHTLLGLILFYIELYHVEYYILYNFLKFIIYEFWVFSLLPLIRSI